jgi:RNase P/RNase MRP subunit p30
MNADLDINPKAINTRDRQILLKRAYALGFDIIAWSTQINASQLGQKHSSSMKPLEMVKLDKISTREALAQRALVVPSSQSTSRGAGTMLPEASEPRQVTRLTLILDDPIDLHNIHSNGDLVRSYDILAVRPQTSKAFYAACNHHEIPLISIDLGRKSFVLPSKALEAAAKRGAIFEININPIISHSTGARCEALSGGQALLLALRGLKSRVIISSGSASIEHLRGPAELSNMGQVLGMPASSSLAAVNANPVALLHSIREKHQKAQPVVIMDIDDFKKKYIDNNNDDDGGDDDDDDMQTRDISANMSKKRPLKPNQRKEGVKSGLSSNTRSVLDDYSGSGNGSSSGGGGLEHSSDDDDHQILPKNKKHKIEKKSTQGGDLYDMAF